MRQPNLTSNVSVPPHYNVVTVQFSFITEQISKNHRGICNVFPAELALVLYQTLLWVGIIKIGPGLGTKPVTLPLFRVLH